MARKPLSTYFEVTCPYCGFVQNVHDDLTNFGGEGVTYCDLEEGGCEGLFFYRYTVKVTGYASAIEGEEPDPPDDPDREYSDWNSR